MSKIIYGEGILSIEPTVEVRGFDIIYSGYIYSDIKLPNHWIVQHNTKRIIGYTMGDSIIGTTDILEYTGNLKIKRCTIATNDESYRCNIVNNATDLFGDSRIQFDVSTSKFDELNKNYHYKTRRLKTKIMKNNLLTIHDEYYFEGNTPVPEGVSYHIHLDTQQAMTGERHGPESVNIYPKLADGRLFDIKKLKIKRAKYIHHKQKKKYVDTIKAKAAQETRGPKIKGPQTPKGEGYTGGGTE